ncbi:amidase [Nitratireductor sp. XY-223]|uniref:amidase n=1 Tax=Nitratireductor sp. XY-223 TaxID=2561926 RepID=UPI0010AAEFBB|nr:amidase [Nitratireductor sp. XY-223]
MVDLDELSSRSASAVGRALAAGEASPVDLTRHLLAKAEADKSGNVFILITHERALAEARASEKRLSAGQPLSPLDGVPIAWKDLVDLAGHRTTAASNIFRGSDPAHMDAPVAANATSAGMVTLGKVNLTEFAYSGLGLNPHYGTPHNPHSNGTPRVPGGSSSGSAVAVAAGYVPCSIGTDTGGSIRIPAAFNGIVGFKPSERRISKKGVFPLSRTLDTVGPLARSVEDCVLLDAVLLGAVTTGVRRRSVSGLRICVPEAVILDDLDPDVEANFRESIGRLEAAGARIVRGPSEIFARAAELALEHGTITAADAYAEHRHLVDGNSVSRIDARVVSRIMGGKAMSAADVITLSRARESLAEELAEFVDGGLVAMPTTAMTAPEIEPLEADDELFHKTNLKVLRNTSIGNFLNMPGLALPNGTDKALMPTSLLLCAVGGADERLLSHGLEVERLLGRA